AARVDCGLARRRLRRLAFLLVRRDLQDLGCAHVAAVALSGPDSARRSLRQPLGRLCGRDRPLLRPAAGGGAARRRHFRHGLLAVPDCQLRVGLPVGGGAAQARGFRRPVHDLAVDLFLEALVITPAQVVASLSANASMIATGAGMARRCARGGAHLFDFPRRALRTGWAAAGASAAAGPLRSPARAAAPPAGKQAAAFYRYKVGDFELTSINDGARSFPMPDGFVKNVSKEEALAAAEAAYMPKRQGTVPFNPQILSTGSQP